MRPEPSVKRCVARGSKPSRDFGDIAVTDEGVVVVRSHKSGGWFYRWSSTDGPADHGGRKYAGNGAARVLHPMNSF